MPVSKKFANFRNSKAKEMKKYLQINLLAKLQYFAIIFSHVLYYYIILYCNFSHIYKHTLLPIHQWGKKTPEKSVFWHNVHTGIGDYTKISVYSYTTNFHSTPHCFKLKQKLISIRSDFPKYYLCLSHRHKCSRR